MKSEGLENVNQSSVGFSPGDVTWIKLPGASWWPAQVADESAVSGSQKPQKKGSGEVLVRLYGTYKYSYVDLDKSLLEFDNVLKRHKGSHRELIQKALKQDLNDLESGSPTSPSARTKGSAKRATEGQDGIKKRTKANCPNDVATPQKSGESARRIKVMQGLGLTAPSGSPYLKNGQTLTIVH